MDNKVAIFDIGSNSVRLFLTDGVKKFKKIITTRLILGISESGELSIDSILRTFLAIKELKKIADDYCACKIYAFATEAVRKAKNGRVLIDMVYDSLGFEIKVLSGKEEAYIGLKGAVLSNNGGIIDIGGASTEVAYINNGDISYLKSVDVGAVLLYDKFKRDYEKINEFLSVKTKNFNNAPSGDYFAIGGTATTISAINLKLNVYDSNKTHGSIITIQELSLIERELNSLSVEETIEKYPVSKTRAEVIAGGASILLKVMQNLKIDKITISENDNLEGYYLSEVKKDK